MRRCYSLIRKGSSSVGRPNQNTSKETKRRMCIHCMPLSILIRSGWMFGPEEGVLLVAGTKVAGGPLEGVLLVACTKVGGGPLEGGLFVFSAALLGGKGGKVLGGIPGPPLGGKGAKGSFKWGVYQRSYALLTHPRRHHPRWHKWRSTWSGRKRWSR